MNYNTIHQAALIFPYNAIWKDNNSICMENGMHIS